MFHKFPREVGPPRKIVTNLKDYLNYINENNGKKKAVYTSVYMFEYIEDGKADYDTAIVDKIFFDFDDKTCKAWQECNLLHKTLIEKDIKHCMVMSGRGYHLYLFTKNYDKLLYKKSAIKSIQLDFIKKLNLTVDPQVIGRTDQMARIPNTYNGKGMRFCIPLTQEQFESGDIYCKELASKQNFVSNIIVGKHMLDISIYDEEIKDEFKLDNVETKSSSFLPHNLMKDFPDCIKYIIKNTNTGWKERYLLIIYFKESGYTINESHELLKLILPPHKFQHCIYEERQLQYLFKRSDLTFPSCEKIHNDGYCEHKCNDYNKVVYK